MNNTIIIGAGVAGLAAGQRLRQLGHDVLILEAQGRIGGRILTDYSNGALELGAEFVHGEKAMTWNVMRDKGQPLQTQDYVEVGQNVHRHIYALNGYLMAGDSPFANEAETWKDSIDVQAHNDQLDMTSVADWFGQRAPIDNVAAKMAQDRISRYEAADASRLSVSALRHEHQQNSAGSRNFRIISGYDRVIQTLAQGLTIRLNTPAYQVNWQGSSAEVVTADRQRLQAQHVVITIPLSLLQAGFIQFDPPLPVAKRQAIHSLDMGHGYKLALRFQQAFWPDIDFLSMLDTVQTWWPLHHAPMPTLMSFTAGPAALWLSALGEAGAIQQALTKLTAVFGAIVREQFVGALVKDWSLDPWARGAYTYTPVGAANARDVLAQPVGPLHFAGEATLSNGHHATVHGAIESGFRAAEESAKCKVQSAK
ncbi:MAG: FAD-dependent oxidoreductase [Chloroflexi bacterium]|nr:FAD-dependent oxidoreductase [Chloroflexota bacterium]